VNGNTSPVENLQASGGRFLIRTATFWKPAAATIPDSSLLWGPSGIAFEDRLQEIENKLLHHLRSYHESLKGFFGWLERKGTILQSPYGLRPLPPLPSPPPLLPEILTPEETGRVIEAVKPDTAMSLRDRSILELPCSTGMRRRELVKLNLFDFSFQRAELLILNPKGKKDRLVGAGGRDSPPLHRSLPSPGASLDDLW
jgi:integrase